MPAVPVQEWALVESDCFAVYTDRFPHHPATFIRRETAYVNPSVREAAHEVFIRRDGKFYLAQSEPCFSHYEPVTCVRPKLMYDPLQGKQIEIVA